jgi:hypothetical protein
MSGTDTPVEPVVATPAVDPAAPSPEVAPAVTQPEAPAAPDTTLLSQDDVPAETPPAPVPGGEPSAPVEGEPKPVEVAPVVVPEPIVYEPPTLPEGVTLANERLAEFDTVIAQSRVPPEARQQLVDMFIQERRGWEQEAARQQQDVWAQTRQAWRDQITSDEQLGGAAYQTSRAKAIQMIDQFVAPAHRAEFENALLATGMGDHPAMFRFLNNLHRKFGAPPVPTPPNGPSPTNGAGKSKRMRDMYTNPRSQRA